jgi:TnpA family transposase
MAACPFSTKAIAANGSEAPHVLDGFLRHESSLVSPEHFTNTRGATEWTTIEGCQDPARGQHLADP